MAKTKAAPKQAQERLTWPNSPKELCERPRVFRIHRMNAFEWQAYCIIENTEYPIGKPDLFDILITKISRVLRSEGQIEFMANKNKAEKELIEKANNHSAVTDV